MLAEFLSEQGEWAQVMPGARACLFSLCERSFPLPLRLEPLHFEVLFCLAGMLTLTRRDGSALRLGTRQVLLLTDISDLTDARVETGLKGVLVAVDARGARESLKAICDLLGGLTLNGAQWEEINSAVIVTVKGSTVLYQTMDLGEDAELILQGNVTIASGKQLRLSKKTTIDGNVTIDGQGIVIYDIAKAGAVLNINAGCTLTNETTIKSADKTNMVQIVSVIEAGKTRGKMVNNGTVQDVTDNGETADWWTGAAVVSSI